MSDEIEIHIEHAVLPPTLKGRITKPAIGLGDRAFIYTPALTTNLAETFRRARAQLGLVETDETARQGAGL